MLQTIQNISHAIFLAIWEFFGQINTLNTSACLFWMGPLDASQLFSVRCVWNKLILPAETLDEHLKGLFQWYFIFHKNIQDFKIFFSSSAVKIKNLHPPLTVRPYSGDAHFCKSHLSYSYKSSIVLRSGDWLLCYTHSTSSGTELSNRCASVGTIVFTTHFLSSPNVCQQQSKQKSVFDKWHQALLHLLIHS